MKSQRRRRQVRPLTIYGFRRGRPKYRGVWLALLVLASLSVLPRVLSPIAEKFWGVSPKAASSAQGVPQPRPAKPEAGSAIAAPEPEMTADTTGSTAAADTTVFTAKAQKEPVVVAPAKAAPSPSVTHARAHRAKTGHRKPASITAPVPSEATPAEAPPPPRPRLIPPP